MNETVEVFSNFLKSNYPEFVDENCEIWQKIQSNDTEKQFEAIKDFSVMFGYTTGQSLCSVSDEKCSPKILARSLENAVEDFIESRKNSDVNFTMPKYFFEALNNDNIKKEDVIACIVKLTDNQWYIDSLKRNAEKIIEIYNSKLDQMIEIKNFKSNTQKKISRKLT